MNHTPARPENASAKLAEMASDIDATTAPDAVQLQLLREIRDELRDMNTDMDRLNRLTDDQVVATVQNRRLAACTLLFVAPSTFAAIPGANFEHLNEYGFDNFFALPILVGLVAASAVATAIFVRKKGWL